MNLRNLPRYSTDTRILGITDNPASAGLPAQGFPHIDGTGDGDGGGGGEDADSADDSDETKDPEVKYRKIAQNLERKLKATPKPEQVEAWKKAEQELKEIRDGQRSESEKAIARAEAAEQELADLKPKLMRLEVAYEKGLPSKFANRLVGSTREELELDADSLMAEFGDAIKADTGKAEAKEKEKRTAARKETAKDAGVRGTRDAKPSGADLWEMRHKKKTAA
jgi:hypothetical protein